MSFFDSVFFMLATDPRSVFGILKFRNYMLLLKSTEASLLDCFVSESPSVVPKLVVSMCIVFIEGRLLVLGMFFDVDFCISRIPLSNAASCSAVKFEIYPAVISPARETSEDSMFPTSDKFSLLIVGIDFLRSTDPCREEIVLVGSTMLNLSHLSSLGAIKFFLNFGGIMGKPFLSNLVFRLTMTVRFGRPSSSEPPS